jgi:hypothetical protein
VNEAARCFRRRRVSGGSVDHLDTIPAPLLGLIEGSIRGGDQIVHLAPPSGTRDAEAHGDRAGQNIRERVLLDTPRMRSAT